MYKFLFKYIIDKVFSLLGIIFLSPIFLLFIILLFFVNKGTPFYLHKRPGLNGTIFYLIKFKTMSDKSDIKGNLLPDYQRITSIGRFLRHYSIDELPQLVNVLLGDMSLIGPRPLLIQYLPLYNSRQARRHEVKPGITGWAQVNGRNNLSWNEKFDLDVWYVDNISFLLDLRIFFITIFKVIKKEGINSASEIPMDTFRGNTSQ